MGKYNDGTIGLDEIIQYGSTAYTLYKKASRDFSEVNRCLEALENSLAYLFAFKAKKESGKKQLRNNQESEKYLRKLKSRIVESEWKKYPEYTHTEALLELSKARYFKSEENLNDCDIAIQNCLILLEKTIQFCKKNSRKRLLKRSIAMKNDILSEFYDGSN